MLSPSVPSSPQPVYPSVLYAQAPSQPPIHGQTKASFDSSTSPAYHATQYVVSMSIISSDPRAPDPAGFPRFLTAGELLLAPRFVSCVVLAFYTVRPPSPPSKKPPSYPPLLLHLPQLPNPSNPPNNHNQYPQTRKNHSTHEVSGLKIYPTIATAKLPKNPYIQIFSHPSFLYFSPGGTPKSQPPGGS